MKRKIKHVAFLVIPNATLLDITGPYEVFSQALEYIQMHKKNFNTDYELHSISIGQTKNVRTSSGMVIHCTENIKTIDYPIDTLFIPGVPNSKIEDYKLPPYVLKWIQVQAKKVRRVCSVCTGSFFLAEAGVLANKKATTHWEKCEVLGSKFPSIQVDDSSLFIKDGNIYTSAGISSGMDLALALVEEDMGRTLALRVAQQMVLYLKRSGSQSQYSTVLTHQHTDHQPIQEICSWMLEHLNETITVESLAERISMSPRNFARVFVRETGKTPAKYIEMLRVESACRYLVDTRLSLKQIANSCGLGTVDNMRKVFLKLKNISPAVYRKNFASTTV